MDNDTVRELKNGLYELTWKAGGVSVAAVGRDRVGAVWFAPTSWIEVSWYDWGNIASARPLTAVAVPSALDPTLRGLLLHALATGETFALQDYLTEQHGDRDLVAAVRANERRALACDRCGGLTLSAEKWPLNESICSCYTTAGIGAPVAAAVREIGRDLLDAGP